MLLHFTLLFPHGTYGWNPEERHKYGNRRKTTREFYVFYMNQCDREGGRLYQEWICIDWLAVENQRMNQKALRADSYKNVKEATDDRRQELAPREDRMYTDDGQQPAIGRKILTSSFDRSS